MGHFTETIDGVEVRRGETFTCAHCNRHFPFKDNKGLFRPPTMCAYEHKPICRPCARIADMSPAPRCTGAFEQKLEAVEARDRFLRAVGIID